MTAFWEHFLVTLKLTLRNKQALIMAYCVPILGVIAFGAYFRSSMPLRNEIAQVLTICIMGGACFGLPTSLVTERESGVWRRYRMTPIWNGWLIISTLLARYLIVMTSGLLQIALAMTFYNMPSPLHPFQMFVAFTISSFAFLGMGLVIAMIVSSPLAVQGVGQMIFLPMLVIGGVGVPLVALPTWTHFVAMYMPGVYSVQAMTACMYAFKKDGPSGLETVYYHLFALLVIGAFSFFCGIKLFRWEPGQKLRASAWLWALLAVVPWFAVGFAAHYWKMVATNR